MSRRSRPPRTRKSRTPEAPRQDVAVVIPPTELPSESLARGAPAPSLVAEPGDEMAALDAGWD